MLCAITRSVTGKVTIRNCSPLRLPKVTSRKNSIEEILFISFSVCQNRPRKPSN